MRVFVTGASGHIGSAVVPELLLAGHQVVGLARSDSSAEALTAAGAEVRRGDLDDLDGLREAAGAADGVIHLAFKHDLMGAGHLAAAAAADFAAIKALAAAIEGTGKPLVTTFEQRQSVEVPEVDCVHGLNVPWRLPPRP